MASTMIEVITAARSSEGTLAVILQGLSSGADVIIAKPEIDSIHDLRGKRVGTSFHRWVLLFEHRFEQHNDLETSLPLILNNSKLKAFYLRIKSMPLRPTLLFQH